MRCSKCGEDLKDGLRSGSGKKVLCVDCFIKKHGQPIPIINGKVKRKLTAAVMDFMREEWILINDINDSEERINERLNRFVNKILSII